MPDIVLTPRCEIPNEPMYSGCATDAGAAAAACPRYGSTADSRILSIHFEDPANGQEILRVTHQHQVNLVIRTENMTNHDVVIDLGNSGSQYVYEGTTIGEDTVLVCTIMAGEEIVVLDVIPHRAVKDFRDPVQLAFDEAQGLDDNCEECRRRIFDLVLASPLATYKWPERSVAPIGYLKGLSITFARVYCKWKAMDPAIDQIAQAKTSKKSIDALAVYDKHFTKLGMSNDSGGADVLRHLFVMLFGLGMRESSGRFAHGPDILPDDDNKSEAGMFQMSYTIGVGSSNPDFADLVSLYDELKQLPYAGYQNIFAEGVEPRNDPKRPKSSDKTDFNDTPGGRFRRFCVEQPALAVEIALMGLRLRCQHWAAIDWKDPADHTIKLKPECDALLSSIQAIVDELDCCDCFMR